MSKDFDIHEWLNYQANLNLLNEEEEDDWDLEAGPEWNVKDLGIGDTIIGNMWDWRKIINMINREHRDDHASANRDIEMWKRVYDEGVTIDSIKNFQDELWIDVGDDLLGWGPSVRWINNLLSPGYKIYVPINEQEEDEWDLEAGPEWNVKDLNVGDVVTPEMWDQEKIKNISISIIRDKGWFNRPHKITRFRQTYLDFVIFDNNKELSLNFVKDFLKPNFKVNFNGLNESLNEGRYDSLVSELARNTMRAWKKQYDRGDKELYYLEEVFNDDFEFEYDLTLELVEQPDYFAIDPNSGADHKADPPFITGKFYVSEDALPQEFSYIYEDLVDFLRHEIEHLTQSGVNLKSGKKRNTMTKYREKFATGEKSRGKYPIMRDEIEPHLQGLYLKAKKTKTPFKDVVKDELDRKGYTPQEQKEIINTWKQYIKGLNLPPIVEQDDDEWDFEAGAEWNEYDGTVVITYVLEDEGYVYLQEDDLEDFESLNPGALDNFDYEDEPVRETNVYKSKPVHIRDLISELDELVGVQAQPYTGEKTTKGFKDWMADNGVDIDSFAYLYDILSPDIIKTTYSDDYGNPVKITPEMKNRIDYGDDGTFYGGIIDVKFNDKLTESDDEWDLEAGPEWNEKELKVGDYYNEYTGKIFSNKNEIPNNGKNLTYRIIYIGPNEGEYYEPNYFNHNIVVIQSLNGGKYAFTIDHFNTAYGPKLNAYVPTDNLNEQDDEWDLEAGPEWNEKELGVGDTVTRDMFEPGTEKFWMGDYDQKVINEFTHDNVVYLVDKDGKKTDSWDVYFVNKDLKDPYLIVNSLTESDDEWDLEAGPEWNVTELGIGDTITSNMWNKNLSPEYGNIEDWIDNPAENQTIDSIDTDDHGVVGILFTGKKSNIQNIYTLEDFNNLLDPKYRIIPSLNESEEDDWDFEAGDEWNVQELTTGDVITSDMVDSNKSNNWFDGRDTLIKKMNFQRDAIDPEYLVFLVDLDSNGNEIYGTDRMEWIGIINNKLIPPYKVVPSM
jgi:hypothetical protein